jgi:prepilin-type N-terminal cleavage/methylation domain-containing protein
MIILQKKGLTLIELLIVIVIIGILTALALPAFLKVQSKVKASEAKGMLKAALVLEKAYYNQHGRYCASLDEIGFVQVRGESEGYGHLGGGFRRGWAIQRLDHRRIRDHPGIGCRLISQSFGASAA